MAKPDVSAISAPTDQRRPLRYYSREMKHILTAENTRLDAECFVVRIPYSLKNSSKDGPRLIRVALDRPVLNGHYFWRKIR